MAIVCVGVDIAKHGFAIHGVDDVGKAFWVQPQVPRAQLTRGVQPPAAVLDRHGCPPGRRSRLDMPDLNLRGQ